ncbi:ribosomal RNA small subunit methyltransferase A, partial [Patescibacteria group bacterium]|nr:ribosomal RNA small subunit methyltransferase A [Patescibacteria group bacterium]
MEILSTFKKYNIRPSKKLAQNFLTDKNILEKIVEAADLNINDIVLEIGPGLGVLTNELSKRCKKIIAVEKDEKMLEVLKDRNYPNIELINKDILKTTIQLPEKYKLIANLPYYITSPIIRMFLEKDQPELMVLMIQKEVAQRICAKNKLSVLSVSVQFYADAKIIKYVSRNCFYPVPKVDSAIIKIIPKQIPNIDVKKFFQLVKMGFSSKRKKLKNNLKPIIKKEIDFDLNLRAEDLSV